MMTQKITKTGTKHYEPFSPSAKRKANKMRIVIVGGGVIGVTTASTLVDDGHEVILVEAGDAVASGTSFANGGQLTVAEAAPWVRPGIIMQMFKKIHRNDAPFRLRPRIDWRQWDWLYRAWRNTSPVSFAHGARRNWQIAKLSAIELNKTLKTLGNAPELHIQHDGILQLYPPGAADDAAEHLADLTQQGIAVCPLNTTDLVKHTPALKQACQAGHIESAILAPNEGSGDAHAFTMRLMKQISTRVELRLNESVLKIDIANNKVRAAITTNGRINADAIILAAGIQTTTLLRPRSLGIRLPILPVKGYSLTLPILKPECAPHCALTDLAQRLVLSRFGNWLRVAGYAEIGSTKTPSPRRIAAIHNRIEALFPKLCDHESARTWVGFRPMTPDGAPIIDKIKNIRGLYVNSGHGAIGWSLAHASARLIANMIAKRPQPIDVRGFAATRSFISAYDAYEK